ncbi:hypothetical protein HAX54_013503 [Datura stramonium]|uniref:Uncharacterized protein n=1 Tax=Datura stramonium TaxID=4076 RepID=A0ABS8TN80_DATST|nr:hypothetical protein [Datura stramonium]
MAAGKKDDLTFSGVSESNFRVLSAALRFLPLALQYEPHIEPRSFNMMRRRAGSGSGESAGGRGFSLTDLFGSSSPSNSEVGLNQPARTLLTLVNMQRLQLLSLIIPYRRMERGFGSSMITFP